MLAPNILKKRQAERRAKAKAVLLALRDEKPKKKKVKK